MGLSAGIERMEMRRLVVVEVHANHDSEEAADLRPALRAALTDPPRRHNVHSL